MRIVTGFGMEMRELWTCKLCVVPAKNADTELQVRRDKLLDFHPPPDLLFPTYLKLLQCWSEYLHFAHTFDPYPINDSYKTISSVKQESENSTQEHASTIEASVELARRAFALRKFEQAVEHYATALEIMWVYGNSRVRRVLFQHIVSSLPWWLPDFGVSPTSNS